MRTFKEIKDAALAALKGKWGNYCCITLIYSLITGIISNIASLLVKVDVIIGTICCILICLALLPPFGYSLTVVFLKAYRGIDSKIADLFNGYKDFLRIVLTMLLKCIYILLWSLLLVVPGIVKTISYAMTEFVLNDNPDLKYDKAISRSSQLMRGHKMDYFLFALSFIGWAILCMMTFGIGYFWLIPYFHTAKAGFYNDLLAEEAKAGNIGNEPQPEILPAE